MDVLIIDDDKNIRLTLEMCLESLGCQVTQAADGEAALAALARAPKQLAFLDMQLEKANGLDLLPALLARAPGLRVVFISAYLDIAKTAEAMRRGAWEVLPKPFTPQAVAALVGRLSPRPTGPRSPAMTRLLSTLERVAGHQVPLLFVGEPGSGTTTLARRAHELSGRSRITEVDCAGQELAFGDGTLLLDEVGELHPSLQARLVKLLAQHPVRVLSTSHRELRDDKGFRRDLLHKLDTVELRVPPLRERREDILPLARSFLAPPFELSADAESLLLEYHWPGNLTELRNLMERVVALAPGKRIGPESLSLDTGRRPAWVGGDFTLDEIERSHVLALIDRFGRLDQAAAVLGIDPSTLWRKRKKLEELKK